MLKTFCGYPLGGKYNINLDEWNKMLDDYYRSHGWDKRGLPELETLVNLGLSDVAEN